MPSSTERPAAPPTPTAVLHQPPTQLRRRTHCTQCSGSAHCQCQSRTGPGASPALCLATPTACKLLLLRLASEGHPPQDPACTAAYSTRCQLASKRTHTHGHTHAACYIRIRQGRGAAHHACHTHTHTTHSTPAQHACHPSSAVYGALLRVAGSPALLQVTPLDPMRTTMQLQQAV